MKRHSSRAIVTVKPAGVALKRPALKDYTALSVLALAKKSASGDAYVHKVRGQLSPDAKAVADMIVKGKGGRVIVQVKGVRSPSLVTTAKQLVDWANYIGSTEPVHVEGQAGPGPDVSVAFERYLPLK